MRKFSDKLIEKIKIHILYSIPFFIQKLCRLWDNVEKFCGAGLATVDNIIRRLLIACWITKVTNTHSEYVILTAFLRQQWLGGRASVFSYTYIACLFIILVCRFKWITEGHVRVTVLCPNVGLMSIRWTGFITYSGVYYNERCYNDRMLQRTDFINKIKMLQRTQMLQRTRRNTIFRRSTRVRLTCRAFPIWLERQSSPLLSFVRFSLVQLAAYLYSV
jgi:hypothetical protein